MTGRRAMGFLKNHGLALAVTGSVMLASLLAKNMVSHPLGYDASCSYGAPLAIWETYSENGVTHSRLVSGEYYVSAIPVGNIGAHSAAFGLCVDAVIVLTIFFVLQKWRKESRPEALLRKSSLALTLLLSLSLWASILTGWESGIYRFFFLATVVLEIWLILAAIIKGAAYSVRGAELLRRLRSWRELPEK